VQLQEPADWIVLLVTIDAGGHRQTLNGSLRHLSASFAGFVIMQQVDPAPSRPIGFIQPDRLFAGNRPPRDKRCVTAVRQRS
jgi:hypothetical protein